MIIYRRDGMRTEQEMYDLKSSEREKFVIS